MPDLRDPSQARSELRRRGRGGVARLWAAVDQWRTSDVPKAPAPGSSTPLAARPSIAAAARPGPREHWMPIRRPGRAAPSSRRRFDPGDIPDANQLRLIFTFCDRALRPDAQLALTLGPLGRFQKTRSRWASSCRAQRWRSACPRQGQDSRRGDPGHFERYLRRCKAQRPLHLGLTPYGVDRRGLGWFGSSAVAIERYRNEFLGESATRLPSSMARSFGPRRPCA